MSKIKICGLYRDTDIEYVNTTKPDFAGFIIDFPSSHRSIDLINLKSLINNLDKNIKSVCVFVNKPVEYIEPFVKICDVIQLHGSEDNEYIQKLQSKVGNIEIWKAFKIKDSNDIDKVNNCVANMVLLDNGYGTGEVFDWSMIKGINREFILAGGINNRNVCEAIKKFNPYAIDLSSSVETNKIKDFTKIKNIIETVRGK